MAGSDGKVNTTRRVSSAKRQQWTLQLKGADSGVDQKVMLHATALSWGSLAFVQPLLLVGLVLAIPVRAALERKLPLPSEVRAVAITAVGLATYLSGVSLAPGGEAFICSFECTFCRTCSDALSLVCPNCAGELLRRPRREPA